MEEKVVVYKFFQGKFTEEQGVKKLNPYGKFLGVIYIYGKTKRGVMCSTNPGVIRNNFIWYPADEEHSKEKAIKTFTDRTARLLGDAENKKQQYLRDGNYLLELLRRACDESNN